MLSEIFWTFFITTGTAFIIGMTKLIYNSKCKEVKCCCLHIIRDTEAEEQIDELRINREPIQQPIQNTV
jgi:hypothetical protein